MDFIEAVKKGDVASVQAHLAADSSRAATRDANGVSAVLLSVFYRQTEIQKLLLAARPPLDLFEAATLGDLSQVEAALAAGADVNGLTTQGFTPLGLAAFFGHPAVVEVLLKGGAELDAVDKSFNANTAMDAAVAGNHTETALLLLSRGANPNVRDSAAFTPLHKAAHHGNLTLIQALLTAGADPSARNAKISAAPR